MDLGIKVGDLMTRDFVSVKPETSLQECSKIMIKKRVGSLVLTENKQLRGLLTERDIIWALTKTRDLKKIKAIEIANKKIVTIKPSADITEALGKMRKSKYRWLPVVIEGKIIGFLTLKDILRIEPSLFEIASSHLFQIKEEQAKLKRKASRVKGVKDGVCEECGGFDILDRIDGKLICDNCKEDM
ncbi:MAG: CBS domain-containing protein [Candidatus Pacearchaeota archaeon]|nr:CBS domain-containing protein [Candidatus Pacearchaeota archaeon]